MTLAGLGMLNAGSASAEVRTATAGSLQWGFKASLLNYHINMHLGTTQGTTEGDGATASATTRGAPETYPEFWNFPFVSGTYDDVTKTYTAQYGGFVALTDSNPNPSTGPGSPSPFKYFKVSNPKVVIDLANNTKQFFLDVQRGANTGPAEPSGPITEDSNFATYPDLATPATPAGDVVTYTNLKTVLTADGAAAFSGQYAEGTELDPVTTSLTAPAGPPPTPTPTTEPTPTTTPTPTPTPPPAGDNKTQTLAVSVADAPGVFSWEITENGTVELTGGTEVAGDFLEYVGDLNDVEVTDARAAGTWSVNGMVGPFTSGTDTIGGQHLGWDPEVATAGANAVAGAVVAPGTAEGEGLASSRPLATGTAGGDPVTGVLDADLTFKIPGSSAPGDYTATFTLTALST